ncbi:histidine phosphatase family protein [Halomicroarcula limicola]|uniref:Histidine phosphatase family protein n=1 Tax=Haloarcula limicola TaxID=1429915 RepID=A0A8J7Y7L3_9EURY|nr:histidine phosphatase family protein [Halomicroarcula limicola]MBV0925552.1 histidine phosphatase family protein [Halomicroarcula limicola]
MSTVLVVRHGETAWNREGRVQGWAPTELTERGREQARRVGSWLDENYDVDRVRSSDLRRTRETAERAVDAAEGLPDPTLDESWRERGFGVYQGFLAEDLFDRHPDHEPEASVSILDTDPEGGESVADFCGRVESAWTDFRQTIDEDETVLLVTHGGVIKVLLSTVADRGRERTLSGHSPPNCSVTEIRLDGERSEVVREGERPEN